MAELIVGIRENESKSYELGQTLENFNESFTKFMSQVMDAGKLGEIEASQEKISQLNATLEKLEAAIGQSKKEVLTQVEAVHATMKSRLMEDLGRGSMANYSDTAVYRGGLIFSILPNRKGIVAYQPLLEVQKVIYETEESIKNIFLWEEYVWILHENHSLCAIDTEEWSVQALEEKRVVKVRPIQTGILILDDEGELALYASEEEATPIASEIADFEVLSNGKLMYQVINELGECIYYMKDTAQLK